MDETEKPEIIIPTNGKIVDDMVIHVHHHAHPVKGTPLRGMGKSDYLRVFKYVIGPMIGILIGIFIGSQIHFKPKVVTGLKSLAAGIVFAALSTELVPEIAAADLLSEKLWIVAGIVIGLALFITLRTVFDKYNHKKNGEGNMPWEMVVAVAFDFFMGAIMIGLAMTVATQREPGLLSMTGLIVAFALGIEMFIMTLSASSQLDENNVSKTKIYAVGVGLALVVLVGGITGYFLGSRFRNTPPYFGILAFGAAVLMWLILEELIVDTGKGKIDSRLQASLIFVGFCVILAAGWFGRSR